MRSNNAVRALFCALVAAACGDSIGPDSGFPKELREITLNFCPEYAPTWLAHQDDGGAWTAVSLVNGKASFAATERQAVAIASDFDGDVAVEVVYSTATTLARLQCSTRTPGVKRISGTVAGVASSWAELQLGDSYAGAGFGSSNFEFFNVADGALDLVASRHVYGSDYNSVVDKVIMRRGQNYASGTALTLDFGSSEAFALQSHALSTTGASGATVMHSQRLKTANGTSLFLDYGNSGTPIKSVPAARLVEGDLHQTSATTSGSAGFRMVSLFYKDPADIVLPFGPALGAPTVTTVSGAPNLRLRAEIAASAAYPSGASVAFQEDGDTYRGYSVTLVGDYFTTPPTKWVLEMPDLSRVPGFKAEWRLAAGSAEFAMVHDVPLTTLAGGRPAAGDMMRHAAWTPVYAGMRAAASGPVRIRREPLLQPLAIGR